MTDNAQEPPAEAAEETGPETPTQTPAETSAQPQRRRRWPRVLVLVAAVLTVALVGGYWYARPLLFTGTGYAAHHACAAQFVSGRTTGDHLGADLPPNPIVGFLRGQADSAQQMVRFTLLGLVGEQRAWFNPGYGCTLGETRVTMPQPAPIDPAPNPFAVSAPSGPASSAPGASRPAATPALRQALARAFGDDLDEAGRTQLGTRAVVVVHGGTLLAERYADGFTAGTPQLGWSMSKSVANLLTGRVVHQGKLALGEDHLRPEWTDQRADITVEQLLRMTSGLSWDEEYALGTPITRMLYQHDDMAAYAAAQPAAHPPGSYRQYSSGSTNILCAVLRERTGAGPELPRELLFAPLGLSSATWEPDGSGTPVCSSHLWASPRDWAAIGQFALQDGVWQGVRLLPQGWMRASTTVQPADGEQSAYAASWVANRRADGTLSDERLPADTYWASGHDGQRMYIVPSADLVVLRLGFTPELEGEELRAAQLLQDVLAATSPPTAKPAR